MDNFDSYFGELDLVNEDIKVEQKTTCCDDNINHLIEKLREPQRY